MKTTIFSLLLSSLIMSASVNAETITACGSTIDSAENVIKEKASAKGASDYKIIAARMGNYTTMSALLIK